MSYIINKTDGTVLTEVVDGTVDQTATDITLVGKNASTYGEFINENFVRLLENFSNTTAPNNPIQGQLWFDTSENRLKVYDGSGFKVSGGAIVSDSVPSTIGQGEIWIDSLRKQLYFNDGVSTILAGPIYTEQQGQSGLSIIDVVDVNNAVRTLAYLSVGKVPLGVFSNESFTLASADVLGGFGTEIQKGFTASTLSGLKFDVVATRADALVDAQGGLKTAETFLFSDDPTPSLSGSLSLTNTVPLLLGPSQNNEVIVTAESFSIVANNSGQNFYFKTRTTDPGYKPTLSLIASTQRVGINTDLPLATLHANGDAIIEGSLTVKGELTTVNTTNLQIEDKLIELGKTDSPSNTTADGGGILVEGGTDGDKLLTWQLGSESWSSSENFNISAGKTYKINNIDVLSYSSLGFSVTSAPGLESIGTLQSLQVDSIKIDGNIISFNALEADGAVILAPKGSGSVSVSNSKITNLGNPENSTDAVNLQTLNSSVRSVPLGTAFDTTGLDNATVANIVSKIFPVSEHDTGTICRVYATNLGYAKRYIIIESLGWQFEADETI
jgi:hypothetical protein